MPKFIIQQNFNLNEKSKMKTFNEIKIIGVDHGYGNIEPQEVNYELTPKDYLLKHKKVHYFCNANIFNAATENYGLFSDGREHQK